MIAAGVPEPLADMNAQAFSLIADGEAAWLSEDLPTLLGRPARSSDNSPPTTHRRSPDPSSLLDYSAGLSPTG